VFRRAVASQKYEALRSRVNIFACASIYYSSKHSAGLRFALLALKKFFCFSIVFSSRRYFIFNNLCIRFPIYLPALIFDVISNTYIRHRQYWLCDIIFRTIDVKINVITPVKISRVDRLSMSTPKSGSSEALYRILYPVKFCRIKTREMRANGSGYRTLKLMKRDRIAIVYIIQTHTQLIV
jgi:hypothetical protein